MKRFLIATRHILEWSYFYVVPYDNKQASSRVQHNHPALGPFLTGRTIELLFYAKTNSSSFVEHHGIHSIIGFSAPHNMQFVSGSYLLPVSRANEFKYLSHPINFCGVDCIHGLIFSCNIT